MTYEAREIHYFELIDECLPAMSHSCSLIVVLLSQLSTFNAKSTPIYISGVKERSEADGCKLVESERSSTHAHTSPTPSNLKS